MCKRIVAGKHTAAIALQNKTFVGTDDVFKVKFTDIQPLSGRINTVDQIRFYIFEHLVRLFKNIDIHHLIGYVVLTKYTDGTGFHPKVDILGHQNIFHLRVFPGQIFGYRQYLMIRFTGRKRFMYLGSLRIASDNKQLTQPLT